MKYEHLLKTPIHRLQDLIFKATIRSSNNWIRFVKNSKFHHAIYLDKIPGINLHLISETEDPNILEIRSDK